MVYHVRILFIFDNRVSEVITQKSGFTSLSGFVTIQLKYIFFRSAREISSSVPAEQRA